MQSKKSIAKSVNIPVFKELKKNQLLNVAEDKKFHDWDILRLSKKLDNSIFTSTECVPWKGYVSKGKYISFIFNDKKHALHRLLYLNYIGDIYEGEYIRYICDNRGVCCNLNHFEKISDLDKETKKILSEKQQKKEKKDFIVEFE